MVERQHLEFNNGGKVRWVKVIKYLIDFSEVRGAENQKAHCWAETSPKSLQYLGDWLASKHQPADEIQVVLHKVKITVARE